MFTTKRISKVGAKKKPTADKQVQTRPNSKNNLWLKRTLRNAKANPAAMPDMEPTAATKPAVPTLTLKVAAMSIKSNSKAMVINQTEKIDKPKTGSKNLLQFALSTESTEIPFPHPRFK